MGEVVAGRAFWVLVWCGILLLGVLGLGASIRWGRETQWRNRDEVLRAVGTMLVSVGMLLLLSGKVALLAQGLLVVALACFIVAFVLGRRKPPSPPEPPRLVETPPRKSA